MILLKKIGLALSLLVAACIISAEVPLIPRKVLFGNPERRSVILSPDGKYLAYLAPWEGVLNIWVRAVGQANDRIVTHFTGRGISHISWLEDSTHLIFARDDDGDENWHLSLVDVNQLNVKEITPFAGVQAHLLCTNRDHPNELLLCLNKNDACTFDVYRYTIDTDTLTLLERNPGNVVDWIVDDCFIVRGRVVVQPNGAHSFELRENGQASWEVKLTWSGDDSALTGPLAFSKDGKTLFMSDSTGGDKARLVKFDLASSEKTVIAEDECYDIGGAIFDEERNEPCCVIFARERLEWHILDSTLKDDFTRVLEADKGDLVKLSRSRDGLVWLVVFDHDNGPATYYTYDSQSKQLSFLFFNQSALSAYPLAEMKPISITARDGLCLKGYLSLPLDSPQGPLPLVLNVHGGPVARDMWGFDSEAQWFANRGYACLQINFRGSSGYGKSFIHAGDREWGGKMHNDLVDAILWAIKEGIADPKKIAIYGWSYGGYAALVGASFTPDLFCCAIDGVGPSNLITLLQSLPPYWQLGRAQLIERIGDPEKDELFLKERSPLFKVDQIKIPVFIVQGAHDPRVKQAESDQMVAAMRARGLECEYMLFPDEGHGCARPENRLTFYTAAEKFLAKHLGGRYEQEEA